MCEAEIGRKRSLHEGEDRNPSVFDLLKMATEHEGRGEQRNAIFWWTNHVLTFLLSFKLQYLGPLGPQFFSFFFFYIFNLFV